MKRVNTHDLMLGDVIHQLGSRFACIEIREDPGNLDMRRVALAYLGPVSSPSPELPYGGHGEALRHIGGVDALHSYNVIGDSTNYWVVEGNETTQKLVPTVTSEWLVEQEACADQYHLFNVTFPSGKMEINVKNIETCVKSGLDLMWLAGFMKESAHDTVARVIGHAYMRYTVAQWREPGLRREAQKRLDIRVVGIVTRMMTQESSWPHHTWKDLTKHT